MDRMRWIFFATLAIVGVGGAHAAETAMTAEQIGQVERVESITIPMPGEFFTAIGKLSRPDWKKFLRTGTPVATASRAQIALGLGTLVADGYVAVEAQDGQGVKNIGKEIINLAKKLNVSQSVLGRGNSLNDFAENNDWSALREELEATQNEVKLDMEIQKDGGLITLVTVGAWVRGMEIASGLVAETYTPEAARLLHQPAIMTYLLDQLAAVPEGMQKEPLILDLRAGLEKCQSEIAPETPSFENVTAVHEVMAEMVREIIINPEES